MPSIHGGLGGKANIHFVLNEQLWDCETVMVLFLRLHPQFFLPILTCKNERCLQNNFLTSLCLSTLQPFFSSTGVCVVACTDTCIGIGERKQHGHYHCPCDRILTRKDSMVARALMHEKRVSCSVGLM